MQSKHQITPLSVLAVSEIWVKQQELSASRLWRPQGRHNPEKDDMRRAGPPVHTAPGVTMEQSPLLGTRTHLPVPLQAVGISPHTTFQGQV